MNSNKSLSLGFEFLDIEIIDHKKEPGTSNEKWNCDECSLFFLSKEKLAEHKNKHSTTSEEALKCRYCSKKLSLKEESKECYANRKCNTCEYKCSKCPLRFQRHSSFVNHEKSHSLLKKKRSVVIKKKHIIEPKSQKVNSPSKTKHTREIVKEQQEEVKQIENNEHSTIIISPKKRKTLPEVPVLLNEKLEPNDSKEMVQTNDKITKQRVNTNKQTPEEKTVREKPNNNTHKNSVNNSSDSMVNYKPFSCHICFENFASGDSLLAHIQTHGESASKGFKCKHCGDEFDDIYKMQYHLAICPLAEDETVFVKSVPLKFHRTPSGGSSRKLTRPKKIIPNTSNEKYDDELTPSFRTRGSIKKRKKTEESSESDTESNSSKYPRRNKASKTEVSNLTNEFVDINACHKKSFDDDMEEDDVNISKNISNDPLNDSFETVEDDKPKVHSCPFPRCGIKFSREKALLCHMRNHNDDFEDSYKCHKCDIPFDDIHLLRSHLNECKDVKEEKEDEESEPEYTEDESTNKSFQKRRGNFICNVCGRTYLSQENMKRHLALHGSSNFICRICKDVFKNQSLLDAHFGAKHPQKSSYHCDICNEDFISELFLNIHESEYHREPAPKQLTEPLILLPTVVKSMTEPTRDGSLDDNDSTKSLCLRVLKSNSYCSTIANIRSSSGNKNQFWCPVCFKQFDNKGSMRLHFRTDHTISTGSVYICEICESEKPNLEMLCYHLEMHSSNILSVNRFSTLRAYVSGRQQSSSEIVPNKSRSKVGFRNFDNKDDFKQLNKTVKAEPIVQRKLKLTKKQRKKFINKGSNGLKRTAGKETSETALGMFDEEIAGTSISKKHSKKFSQPKNVRNNGKCKLTAETSTRKVKINRNNRLVERKRRQFKNRVKSDQEPRNSMPHDSSPEHSEDYKHDSNSSDYNSSQDNIKEEFVESTNKNQTNAKLGSSKKTKIKKNNLKKDINAEDIFVDTTKTNLSNDYSEEICCSMCSMVFYHQDELLDHVATHI